MISPKPEPYTLRRASIEDVASLHPLIARSARELSTEFYEPSQVDAALTGAFGVDTQLILDGTYYVVEHAEQLVACGGWSFRRTPFGSDQGKERDASALDPQREPAKIRAFFVHPEHARKGLGSLLLEQCEAAALARGFSACALTATLPGRRFYEARGYIAGEPFQYELGPGLSIGFVPMHKPLTPHGNRT